MRVTVATKDDLVTIRQLLCEFREAYKGSSIHIVRMNIDKTMGWIEKNMEYDFFRVWLLDKDQGFMVASLTEMPYVDGLVAGESLWYTRPSVTSGGMRLLDAFHKWGEENNVTYYGISVPERRKALERLGYTEIETIYGRSA